ncbi:MAG: hypothetical protein F6K44_25335 [Moorea sp. SIO3E2]|uniref:Uncharacterized protein n=1 Tax=Moorena producens 3L TaxID=489825 RepID=F4XT33_9CYAN|nr:hypothetical protein [Moorena sp. SIO4E2]EGJ32208.1 hypothetical protein LYNGBM3L_26970 [Moorena producens 3L]NEQ16907.1 hypothetical protein [Moorena sp. SIO3E2]NES43052.1 hypothetical protein [Moorena sp. SIO2C4]
MEAEVIVIPNFSSFKFQLTSAISYQLSAISYQLGGILTIGGRMSKMSRDFQRAVPA